MRGLDSNTFYTMDHIAKGQCGEDLVRSSLINLGYYVFEHLVTEPGVDGTALLNGHKVIVEVLNWYGGYIHPRRFRKIILNLIETPADERYLVCIGVDPTKEQKRLLVGYGIKLIHTKNDSLDPLKDLTKEFKDRLGVITLVHYNYKMCPSLMVRYVWTVGSVSSVVKEAIENWLYRLVLDHLCKHSMNFKGEADGTEENE